MLGDRRSKNCVQSVIYCFDDVTKPVDDIFLAGVTDRVLFSIVSMPLTFVFVQLSSNIAGRVCVCVCV